MTVGFGVRLSGITSRATVLNAFVTSSTTSFDSPGLSVTVRSRAFESGLPPSTHR